MPCSLSSTSCGSHFVPSIYMPTGAEVPSVRMFAFSRAADAHACGPIHGCRCMVAIGTPLRLFRGIKGVWEEQGHKLCLVCRCKGRLWKGLALCGVGICCIDAHFIRTDPACCLCLFFSLYFSNSLSKGKLFMSVRARVPSSPFKRYGGYFGSSC